MVTLIWDINVDQIQGTSNVANFRYDNYNLSRLELIAAI